jgi:hypothetical protein
MDVRYYHDPITGLPHIFDHGVTEAEVEWVLARPGEEGRSSGGTRQSIGQSAAGRYLRVIYVPDAVGDGVFVVTAYPLTGKTLKAYRRRKKRGRR